MSATLPSLTKLYTAGELFDLPDDGYCYELIRGELHKMPPPGGKHGSTTARLLARAAVYAEDNDLGEGFTSETGFLLARDPDTVLAPDFAFVAKERLPDSLPEKYLPVVPDLVLETRSPSDTRRRVSEKVQQWLQFGVRMVWELDPKARILTVYRPGAEPRKLGLNDTLSGEDVLPGFSLPIRRLFRETAG